MIKRAGRAIKDINSYISPTDFYPDDSEKTNINWMCFKYAKDILRMIADEPIDILRGEKIIKEIFPTIRKNLVDAIYFATAYGWDQFFRECRTTIIDCISDINGKKYLFDDPKYN